MTRILKLPEVMAATALSRSSIYAYIQAKKFPAPVRIGVRAVGWESELVTKWLEDRINASRQTEAVNAS